MNEDQAGHLQSKPLIEECAEGIYKQRNGFGCAPWSRREKSHKTPYLSDAKSVLDVLRRRQLITTQGLQIIKQELGE